MKTYLKCAGSLLVIKTIWSIFDTVVVEQFWGGSDYCKREGGKKMDYLFMRENPLFIHKNYTFLAKMADTPTLHLAFLYSADTKKQNTYYYYFT